jgi:hypothetical protein
MQCNIREISFVGVFSQMNITISDNSLEKYVRINTIIN